MWGNKAGSTTARSKSLSSSISRAMISSPAPHSFKHIAHVGVNKDGIFEASKDTPTTTAGLLGHSNAFGRFDGPAFLVGLKMPTTILAGQDDRLMPVQNSENLAKGIPGARLVLVPDCQHGAQVQCEDLVIREIEKVCR